MVAKSNSTFPSRSPLFVNLTLVIGGFLPLLIAGCGGGGGSLLNGGGQGSTSFKLTSCSLGGAPCGTATNVVQQTQSLTFTFNESVAPNSVTSETLQILEVDPSGGGGAEPPGLRVASGNNVTFTPEVSFDSNGNVSYGFKPGKTYRITIPKAPQTAIQSVGGHPNTSSVTTTIFVSNQLADIVPGPPTAHLSLPTAPTGSPLDTAIEVTFSDIMNVSTLVNKLQGTSQTLSVYVDLDGNLATTNDQIIQTGLWDINFDSIAKETTVRFTHTSPLPSPGPSGQRTIVVAINGLVVKDLGGNSLVGPSVFTFQTGPCNQQNAFNIVEDFANNTNEEGTDSGANMWNPGSSPGLLVSGKGGGNGQHGALLADTSFDVGTKGALATDGTSVAADQNFNSPGRIPFVVKAIDGLPAVNENTSKDVTVTDGIFQFSSFTINTGVTLRLEGSKPARIFSRGNVNINGTLDVGGANGSRSATTDDKIKFTGINTGCTAKNISDAANINGWGGGTTGCPLFPQYPVGKPGGRGGPNGGDGGNGGDLPTNLPYYPSATAVLFKSFDGQNGATAPQFPGGAGATAGGGAGTLAVPVFNFGGTNIYANFKVPTATATINVDIAGTVAAVSPISNSDPTPALCEGIVGHTVGVAGQPGMYSIQMGAPAGGGASHREDGTIGTWCQEAAVTAACGANGANKKAVPSWATVTTAPPLTVPPAKVDTIPFYPSPPTGVGGLKAIASEPSNFGSDGLGNFSMLRAGAGGGGGGVNCFGTAGSFTATVAPSWQPTGGITIFPLFSVGCAGGGGGGALQAQSGRNFTIAAGGFIRANGGDGGDHLDHPTCTARPGCSATLDQFTAGKLWGQTMSPGGGGGGGSVLIQANGTASIAAASVSVRGGFGGDGRFINDLTVVPAPNNILTKFQFAGIATNIAFHLRGGEGGNGRWHYQLTNLVNLDSGFDPPQASNTSSTFNGINIAAADFSGAQSKWILFPPTSGSFVQLTGYDLTISTTGGSQVLVQDDVLSNQVLAASFAAGGTLPVRILFQGTRPNILGQPDLAARTPWTDQVSTLSVASPRFVRFVVVFSRAAQAANPSFLGVDKIDIKGTGENCTQ